MVVEPVKSMKLIARINSGDLHIIDEIFFTRRYSDYFPFKKEATVLDIGCHNGYFCIFASSNLGTQSRIIGYEPVIENFNIAQENIQAMLVTNIEIHNKGVSGKTGRENLYFNRSNLAGHSLFSKKVTLENNNKFDTREVEVISLKDIFENNHIDRCDFLKMDCEGSEYPILFNCPQEVLDKVLTISMEFHDIEGENNTGLDLIRFLKAKGFNIVNFRYSSTNLNLNFGSIAATKE